MSNLSKLDLNLENNLISSVGFFDLIKWGINEMDNLLDVNLKLDGNDFGDDFVNNVRDGLK